MTTALLSATGNVYVTYRAAREYADAAAAIYAEGQPIRDVEEARRELTALLLDARHKSTAPDGLEQWRYRSRSTGADITAHVTRDKRLAIVVHVTARFYAPSKPR